MISAAPHELTIQYQPVKALTPSPHNPRTHSKRQLRQIARSIEVFGFTNPLLIDHENKVVAGHGRLEAAKLLGLDRVPTVKLAGLTPDQIRAYIVADNQLAQKSGWDQDILRIELEHLISLDLDFDVSVLGFEAPEIDFILQSASDKEAEQDNTQLQKDANAVTQLGDVWQLGQHRVLCGNALHESSFQALMGKKKAKLIFADAPYNVRIDGHATGNGEVHHRNFAMACGEMSQSEFIAFLTTSFQLLARHSIPNSLHYLAMDWRHLQEMLAAGKHVYSTLLNLCVWTKNNPGMGSFYRSQHELIFVFRNGTGQHTNNVELGKYGRNRSNVWHYPGMNSFGRTSEEGNLLLDHPTAKPVPLVVDAILDGSGRGDLILDSFLGSGTTLIAAQRVGRICYGIELDPLYVDLAIRRWEKLSGEFAIHAGSGKSFREIATESEGRDA